MSIGFLALRKFATEFQAFRSASASEIEETAEFLTKCQVRLPEDVDGLLAGYVQELQEVLIKRLVRGVWHEAGVRDLAAKAAKDWIDSNIGCSTLETKVAAVMWTESFRRKALEEAFLRAQDDV